eukprot:TRINITY_DN3277_c0_g2_i1.p1 TRINITY_DN3277_c0_g2~~TRINITY_DN3277_c0_g2_i1.p1  ORF type:complete len:646 (+),score=95.37 TRINITY_DN3277_c0_g2_i1:47-1984(+)
MPFSVALVLLNLLAADGDRQGENRGGGELSGRKQVPFVEANDEDIPDGKCGGKDDLNRFDSVEVMESAGWVFTWNDEFRFRPSSELLPHMDLARVPTNVYWGTSSDPSSNMLLLNLTGYGNFRVDYGNIGHGGSISLFFGTTPLNSTAYPFTPSKIATGPFATGNYLIFKIQNSLDAVLVINSIEFSCSQGKRAALTHIPKELHVSQDVCPVLWSANANLQPRFVCPKNIFGLGPKFVKNKKLSDILSRPRDRDDKLILRLVDYLNRTRSDKTADEVENFESALGNLRMLAQIQATEALATRESWTDVDTDVLRIIDPLKFGFVSTGDGIFTTEAFAKMLPSVADLKELVTSGTLALIGSGGSLQNHSFGRGIDNHDQVGRFNDLVGSALTNATETGVKTTVHVVCAKADSLHAVDVRVFDLEWFTPWRSYCARLHSGGPFRTEGQRQYFFRPSMLCSLGSSVRQFTRGFLAYWFIARLFPPDKLDMFGFSGSTHYLPNKEEIHEQFLGFEHLVYSLQLQIFQEEAEHAKAEEAMGTEQSGATSDISSAIGSNVHLLDRSEQHEVRVEVGDVHSTTHLTGYTNALAGFCLLGICVSIAWRLRRRVAAQRSVCSCTSPQRHLEAYSALHENVLEKIVSDESFMDGA